MIAHDFSEVDVESFEQQLFKTDDVTEAKTLLQDAFNVTAEHLNFLTEIGGIAKLRQFFYEVIKFDLTHGTRTSDFFSEANYKQVASNDPSQISNPDEVESGVKHRSSLTCVIDDSYEEAVRILRNHGYDPKTASLYDLGCGEGKAVLIGMSEKYPFKRAFGVDYYKPVLDIAQKNVDDFQGNLRKPKEIHFQFKSAAEFQDFNGLNVVYLYNPFDEKIMTELEQHMRKSGGTFIVLYNKPEHAEVFNAKGWKKEQQVKDTDPDKRIDILSWNLDRN